MTLRFFALLSACVVVCTSACGGSEFDSPGAGGGAGGAGAGGAAGTVGGAAGASPSGCPVQMPGDSDSCSDNGLACSYGHDPRPGCRWRYRCESDKWQVIDQPDTGSCETLAAGCPGDPPSGACAILSESCVYPADGTFCRCATGDSTPEWKCGDVPSEPCPTLLPNEGELCSASSSCDYACNVESQGVQASCDQGVWTWGPCP